MVGDRPARPALGHLRLQLAHRAADVRRAEILGEQLEAVAHVQPAVHGVLGHRPQRILRGDLAQRRHVGIAVHQRTQLGEEAQVLRLRVVVVVVLERVRIGRAEAAAHALLAWLGRVVAQLAVVEAEVDRVQADAVHALVQPETHIVQRGRAHVGVVEVQVRLRGEEVVQVVLAAARLPLPCTAAEQRQPVVRRRAVGPGVGPHVPVGLRVVAALPAFAEPCVLGRGMAEHLVDHHLQPQPVRLVQQAVEILQRAEQRIDLAVIGDVVAEIRHRRLEERRHPDRVHAKLGHVVEPLDDAGQISHPVPVGVEKAARVDLVDDGATPPRGIAHSPVHAVATRGCRTRRVANLSGLASSLAAADRPAAIVHTYSWIAAAATQHQWLPRRLDVQTNSGRNRRTPRRACIRAAPASTRSVRRRHAASTGRDAPGEALRRGAAE